MINRITGSKYSNKLSHDKNNIVNSLNLSPEIKEALNKGMKYYLNNFRIVKSKKIKELNKNYLVLQNTENNTYFVIDLNNSFYVDSCKYYSFRIKLKELWFGSRYELMKLINENK